MDAVSTKSYTNVRMIGWVHIDQSYWNDDDHLKIWATLQHDGSAATDEVCLLDWVANRR